MTTRTDRTFEVFAAEVEQLLGGTAGGKGYSDKGPDGPNQLYEFVHSATGDHGHAAGEIIYKVVRYMRKRNPEDLLKAAAWAFLIWRHHESNS